MIRTILIVALVASGSARAQNAADTSLSSVAIDTTLFRDGAVKRFSGTHEAWSYVCDEVTKMKQRFCSLRTKITDNEGRIVAALTVSTGDDGRPAGLLRIGTTSFDETGVEILAVNEALPRVAASSSKATSASPPKPTAKAKPSTPAITRLYPAACKVDTCEMVWTLTPEQIEALSSGSGLALRFRNATPGVSSLANALKASPRSAIQVAVSGRGFAAAVDASVKPIP